MKTRKEKILLFIGVITLLLVVSSATYAFFMAQGGTLDLDAIDVKTATTDSLTFNIGKNLLVTASQDDFKLGTGNHDDTTTATAVLRANNNTNNASAHYYFYLNILKNEFKHVTESGDAELVLTVTKGGTPVTIAGLGDQVTVKGVTGYDITEVSGLIEIANTDIVATPTETTKTDEYEVTITLINLDYDQNGNAGKSFDAELIMQKDKKTLPAVVVATSNIPMTVGALANVSCTGSTSTYNPQYNRIEISSVNYEKTDCILDYTDRTTKTLLNQKIMDLAKTAPIQGIGQVVNEKVKAANADASYSIAKMNYTKSSGSDMTVSGNKYTGTDTTAQSSTYSKFTPTSNGFYKVCYIIPSSASISSYYSNYLGIYVKNSTSALLTPIYSNYKNGAEVTGCYDYGYVTTSDFIYIRTYYYDQNITLWFEKTDNYSEVSAGTRYEGQNPNNYVWFNNELWRIIGVFDSASHGQSGQNLVKIIRANPIGNLAWDKSPKNNWSTSNIYKLLNPVSGDNKSGAYYNAQDGTGGDYCYGKCDYDDIGIQNNYRSMIEEVTWYLGGSSTNELTAEEFYRYEREEAKYRSNLVRTTGYIGLMYPSDYGYAVPADNCVRTAKLSTYNNVDCTLNNWLYGNGYEWTITPSSSDSSSVFIVNNDGGFYLDINTNGGRVVRPVLYLDSNTYVIDGDGREINPYIIGM